jgi:hypothetical protein
MDKPVTDGNLPVAGLGEDEQQRIRDILARLNDEGWGDAEITIRGETSMSGHMIDNDDFEDACEESEIAPHINAASSMEQPPNYIEETSTCNVPAKHSMVEQDEPQEERPSFPDNDITNAAKGSIESVEDLQTSSSPPVDSTNSFAQSAVGPPPVSATQDDGTSDFCQQIICKLAPPADSKLHAMSAEESSATELAADATSRGDGGDGGDGSGGVGEEGTLLDRLLKKRAASEPESARQELPEVQVWDRASE